MWAASDEALLAGFGTGDPTAAAAFIRRFQRRVYGLALVVVNDEGRAEDIAQEAFVRAWRHATAYDARKGSVATWLLAITRNLAIDAVRVQQARPADVVDLSDLGLAASDPDPGEVAEVDADVARMRDALGDLPVEQRRALVLAALHGLTAREIGEREGIPLGTAKTRIRSGLMRLRATMTAGELGA
ncbi:MAG TPA: sigma-70 family RNA polymerase sigma factor [Acidimicrobiales bacterium]